MASNVVYVWTAGGTLAPLAFPMDLAAPPANSAQPTQSVAKQAAQPTQSAPAKIPEYAIEPFIDNLRRTVSSVSQYSEIPYNNVISTRQLKERLPVFKFQVGVNKNYKLNVLIRAKVDYRFTVPILAKYTIETNSPGSFMNYRATFVSSHEVNTGTEQNSNVLGSVLNMVVDSKLSLIRITATFQTNAAIGMNGAELRIHHGLKTDDPEATLYALEGSYAALTEVAGI